MSHKRIDDARALDAVVNRLKTTPALLERIPQELGQNQFDLCLDPANWRLESRKGLYTCTWIFRPDHLKARVRAEVTAKDGKLTRTVIVDETVEAEKAAQQAQQQQTSPAAGGAMAQNSGAQSQAGPHQPAPHQPTQTPAAHGAAPATPGGIAYPTAPTTPAGPSVAQAIAAMMQVQASGDAAALAALQSACGIFIANSSTAAGIQIPRNAALQNAANAHAAPMNTGAQNTGSPNAGAQNPGPQGQPAPTQTTGAGYSVTVTLASGLTTKPFSVSAGDPRDAATQALALGTSIGVDAADITGITVIDPASGNAQQSYEVNNGLLTA